MQIPQDVTNHCNSHPGCKGCPLGTCTAPLVNYGDPRWDKWIESRIEAVREIKNKLPTLI